MAWLQLFDYQFLKNALLASCAVAACSAVIGYFLISRSLTFAGHALPNIGFAGAAGAVFCGLAPVYGLFAFTIVAALIFAAAGERAREKDLGIGVVMIFCLGLGLLFLTLYPGYGEKTYGILFGTILGISQEEVRVTLAASLAALLCMVFIFRPLLFSTLTPDLARVRGVPVSGLAAVFLVLVAVTVSLDVQITGSLLVFTLLVGPSAAAKSLARRPAVIILLAVLLAEVYVVGGIGLAVVSGTIPVSFFVAALSFLVFVLTRFLRRRMPWRR